jgi:hypothetical protein
MRAALMLLVLLFTVLPRAYGASSPRVHLHADLTGGYFDTFWCRGSTIPVQDPVFPSIRRNAFEIDPATDLVTIPTSWLREARELRWPQLLSAAESRLPILLSKVEEVVGRPFVQRDFNFFFYFCPAFGGGSAIPSMYPLFPYLRSAVSELQWPDWLFTDQYVFHELLHLFVLEKIDYARGSPVLNTLYGLLLADATFEARAKAYLRYPTPITPEYAARWEASDRATMIGLALSHVHVYAVMSRVLRALGERDRLNTIRAFETGTAASHPSYAWAWGYIESIENNPLYMRTLLDEVKTP